MHEFRVHRSASRQGTCRFHLIMDKLLVVILGPTGCGKSDIAVRLAEKYATQIISADSRQMYRDIPTGTAAPSASDLARVPHHFIGNLTLDRYYSAAQYETDAIRLIDILFSSNDLLIMCGGSMMYIDAVCNGIDDIPTVLPEIREELLSRYNSQGLEPLTAELRILDPEYWKTVDQKNPKRIIHALEICYQTGQTFTSFRTKIKKERAFKILKIGLNRPREELYRRINKRVDTMIQNGLVEEALKVYPYRKLNSLNTVGYKELFSYFDKEKTPDGDIWSLDFAIEKIKQNSRIYSRKQITWFKRDQSIHWFHPDQIEEIEQLIEQWKQ